jgi:hypothetical protein
MKYSEFNEIPDLTGKVIFITGGMYLHSPPDFITVTLTSLQSHLWSRSPRSNNIRNKKPLSHLYQRPQHLLSQRCNLRNQATIS